MPVFRLMAQIRDFRPDKLKLSDKYVNTAYSLNLGADFTGNSIDDIEGKIEIDSLSCVSENVENNYFLPSFKLIASKKDDGKTVDIKSDFFNGQIVGNYSSVGQFLASLARSAMGRPNRLMKPLASAWL